MAFIERYDNGLWHIESEIGEGDIGHVYKISKQERGYIYTKALKVIQVPGSITNIQQLRSEGMKEEAISRYLRKILQEIKKDIKFVNEFKRTDNIVRYEDYKVFIKEGELGYNILLRMELLESLEEVIASRRIDEAEAAKMGIDICKALELLAKNKMIHGDIKPGSIMSPRHGDYKLGGFGLARQFERTSSLSNKDSCSYMAPEVYKQMKYGATVDFYSLGLVLYWVMNNRRLPFIQADGVVDCTRRMNGETIPPPACASKGMAEIILKACAYDRRQRYQRAIEMRSDLERLLLSGIARSKNKLVSAEARGIKPSFGIAYVKKDESMQAQADGTGILKKYYNDKIVLELPRKANAELIIIGGKNYEISIERLKLKNKILSSSDLLQLPHFANLVEIEMIDCEIEDLSPISGLTKLTTLNLTGNKIVVVSSLSGLTNLTTLNLSGNKIADVSPLSGLSNLTTLNLSGNKIVDIDSLSKPTNLTYLDLGKNEIKDVTPLSSLIKLASLNLSGNKIVDISSLSELNNLTYLDLGKNEIKDVTPLSGLIKLASLNASANQIRYISSLSELFNLIDINVDGNHIADLSPLSELYKLKNLVLGHNPIRDLKPLCKLVKPEKIDLRGILADSSQMRILKAAFRECTILR
jgi:Leucine-rich repeat (LRR) protein